MLAVTKRCEISNNNHVQLPQRVPCIDGSLQGGREAYLGRSLDSEYVGCALRVKRTCWSFDCNMKVDL